MKNALLSALAPAVARVLIAAIFLWSGFGKITGFAGTTEYMAAKGMPLPALFLLGAIVFEIVGGLSVLAGFKARWGALLLIAFLIPTTFIFHAFWAVDAASQRIETIQFMKNLAILGGLLMVLANDAGPLGIDGMVKRCCCKDKTEIC